MEKITTYHRLYLLCLGAAGMFGGISIVVFARLKIWEILRIFRRKKEKKNVESIRFRLDREILLIHTNEIIE